MKPLQDSPRAAHTVGVRKLRDGLSRYVARVRAGESFVVTERGHPVAKLVGVDTNDPLAQLVEEGSVSLPAREADGSLPRRVRASLPVSDLVADQRR